jgi:hypothetical protein
MAAAQGEMSMSHAFRSSPAALAALVFAAGGIAGCGFAPPSPEGPEQVMLAIAVVPTEVRCVRVTAAGPGRTLERELDAVGGMPLTKNLAGLPLGTVTIAGEAFPSACDAVSKSTIPAWVSDPVEVSIVLGRSTTVELTMVRNGRAKLDVNFSDEPPCSPGGASCLGGSECCSKSCSAHVCAGGDVDAGVGEVDAAAP